MCCVMDEKTPDCSSVFINRRMCMCAHVYMRECVCIHTEGEENG